MAYSGGKEMKGVDWSYYDKFTDIEKKYLPDRGEGDTMATQIVTATTKLVYKWYNDGDVYDNTYYMSGWWNNLSSYANWLVSHVNGTKDILDRIKDCHTHSEYENILKDLVDLTNTEEFLKPYTQLSKWDSIYECDGPYRFDESCDNDDEYDDDYDEEEDY